MQTTHGATKAGAPVGNDLEVIMLIEGVRKNLYCLYKRIAT
jgi:hypothetical protein